ncbi:MAG TPA: MFS transporter [Chthoniobacterales bacterium]
MITHSAPPPRSRLPILLLSAAGFTILTTEFVIIGLLPPMARDLGVSVSQAGLLVTLFAVTVAVAGPLLTARVAHCERKTLFVSTLLFFALSNVLAAVSPNIAVMAVARFVPALMLPVFWSLASETGMRIMGPDQAGKAVSMVGFGIVAATIFGIPIGTLISDRFGWRTAFAAIAVLASAKAVLLFVFLPTIQANQDRVPVWRQMGILRGPRMLGHVLLSLLVFAGMFTAYTYLADILEKLGGLSGAAVGWILMGFGGIGLLGNWLGGRFVDRHPLRASILFCVPLAIGLLLLVPLIKSPAGLTLVLGAWGICQAALFTVSHTRVMKAAESTPALGASLNISGANFGIAVGALLGSRVIDLAGLEKVSVAAAVIVILAIVAAVFAMSTTPRDDLQASLRPVLSVQHQGDQREHP